MMLYGIGSYAALESERRSTATYHKVPPRFLDTLDSLPQPTAAPATSSYTVQKGDTLAEIVRRQLQTQGKPADNVAVFDGVREVAKDNGLANANRIHVGQSLDLGSLGGSNVPQISPMSAALTPLPPVDVKILPPLPKKHAEKPLVETKPLEAPSASSEGEKPAPSLSENHISGGTGGGGGGKSLSLGPMAAFSAQRSVMLSPGPQGGPSHALGRDLLAELTPDVRYPTQHAGGRPDLTALIDRILSGAPDAETESVPKTAPSTDTSPWQRAVDAPIRITSDFGPRKDPFTHKADFHDGLDLAAASGSDIHPLMPGTVSYSGWKSGYGRVVIVDHGDGIESVYGHNSKNLVHAGDAVTEKSVLGHVGSSGRATGPHLHLEVRQNGKAIDPVAYLATPNAPAGAPTLAKND